MLPTKNVLFIKNLQNFSIFFNIRIAKSVYLKQISFLGFKSLKEFFLNKSLQFHVLAKGFMIRFTGQRGLKSLNFQADSLLFWHNYDFLKISLESRKKILIVC